MDGPTPENRPSEEQAVATRRPNGTFGKGVSGNPGGRPAALVHVRELAGEHTPAAIATLAAIARDEKAPAAARVAACSALLDRAWGRPQTPVAISDGRCQAEERERGELMAAFHKIATNAAVQLNESRRRFAGVNEIQETELHEVDDEGYAIAGCLIGRHTKSHGSQT